MPFFVNLPDLIFISKQSIINGMQYISEDTIAALSTPAGRSAIAVIRLSGENAFSIMRRLFKPSSDADKQVRRGYIMDGDKKVDEVLCSFFKAPRTYTGEDTAEISVHGNPVIINAVLNLLYKNGARAAGPGEFTYRAFLNGKKDLAEAEAVCSLITSKTETAAKAALNNVSGEFSNKVRKELDSMTMLLAYLEASLDYPEDDIPFLSQEQKKEMINTAVNNNQKLIDMYKTSKNLQNGLKSAIIGKPNAGKSSLLNAILGKNRAIVTDIAGTTTDTIEEIIDCRGIPLILTDTAGIRNHAENSIEILGQERSKEAAGKADILLWVFDSSSPLDKNDAEIAAYLKTFDFKDNMTGVCGKSVLPSKINEKTIKSFEKHTYIIGILNKADLPQKINEENIKTLAVFDEIISLSAKSGAGMKKLLETVSRLAGVSDAGNEYLLINSRHQALLRKAQESLIKTRALINEENADELACFEVKNAAAAMEEVLGVNTPHDILDSIFGSFCIGK